MPQRAVAATRPQKQWINDLRQQCPASDEQRQHSDASNHCQQQQGRRIHGQHRTKQQMQQVGLAAIAADQRHTQRQASQIKGGQMRILPDDGFPARHPHAQRHDQPGGQPACTHGPDVLTGNQVARRHTWQHGVTDGVSRQAHAPQLQQHTQGRRAQRQAGHAKQSLPHEIEFGKRLAKQFPQHGVLLRFHFFASI